MKIEIEIPDDVVKSIMALYPGSTENHVHDDMIRTFVANYMSGRMPKAYLNWLSGGWEKNLKGDDVENVVTNLNNYFKSRIDEMKDYEMKEMIENWMEKENITEIKTTAKPEKPKKMIWKKGGYKWNG